MTNRGFTLIEILVAMTLTAMVLLFVTYFSFDVSTFGTDLTSRLQAEFELQLTFRTLISEIRSMGPGENGAYPIATATDSTFTFFTDVEGDGTFEQVRYFLDGTTLKKGVIYPTVTEPVQYPPANEIITEVVHYLVPGVIFTYFPEGYPYEMVAMISPVDVAAIRLVTIIGTVDQDTASPPLPATLSISVTIRNLRGEI